MPINPFVQVDIEDGHINIQIEHGTGYCRSGSGLKSMKSMTGTARASISNMVHGVSIGASSAS